MAKRPKDDSNTTVLESSAAPAPAPKEGPEPGRSTGRSSAPEHTTQPEPGTVLFGQPSVIKPTSYNSSLFMKAAPSSTFANYSQPSANAFNPTARLEAYTLRPTVQSTDTVSTLSYGIESLRLSEEAMQTQVHSLGPKYSIIDVLLDLQPQQLHLVQLRASQCQGHIVSVEHGKPVNLPTLVGSLLVKPTIFMISTKTFGALYPTPAIRDTLPTIGWSLFRSVAPVTGFGASNTGSTITPAHYLPSPETFSKHLQEQGELCTCVESTDHKGAFEYYQTITMDKDWHNKDRSLEEIRLADYDAGRNGPTKTNGISCPWDRTYNSFGGLGKNDVSQHHRPKSRSRRRHASQQP